MTSRREHAAVVGLGAAACAACCAGPILGLLAAIGLGTVAGAVTFGAVALAVGALAVAVVLLRRRRRASACVILVEAPIPVAAPTLRGPR